MMTHHHFSLVTAFSCCPMETLCFFSSFALLSISSSVTRSRVNLNWRMTVSAVKMATASMMTNHCVPKPV